jgi:hypothetical protein
MASGVVSGVAAAAAPTAATAPDALAGTSWRLLQFQSMDDAIGTLRPEDSSLYTLRLNSDGTVTMRLNCNRAMGSWSAEPSGHVAAAFLKPAVGPDGSVATGPDDSALRAGLGDFDATGTLPCGQASGQPLGPCEFGVARSGGGYATVVIRWPDGRSRAVYFRMGRPIGADTSQADGDPRFSSGKQNDLHLIRGGNARYEIPDAVILGG